MAKRPSTRSEARDTSTAIDIDRERTAEPLDSGVASTGTGPNEDEIRRRAYQRYLERGGGDGQDFDDWLEAERELRQK